jgi:Protein of unknown function (DUF1573)
MEKKNQLVIGLLLLALAFGGYTAYQKGLVGSNMAAAASAPDAAGMVTAPNKAEYMANLAREQAAKDAQSGNIPGSNSGKTVVPAGPPTTMKFAEESFDFGSAKEGDVVKHVFKFTNTGDQPLIIANAKGSCGCTVPTWPKEAIAPGATGEINIEFSTAGKPGQQSKRVTVTANTVPTDTFIEIKGMVNPK